jgi:hypothetical protein
MQKIIVHCGVTEKTPQLISFTKPQKQQTASQRRNFFTRFPSSIRSKYLPLAFEYRDIFDSFPFVLISFVNLTHK